jgi:hypothetical protein
VSFTRVTSCRKSSSVYDRASAAYLPRLVMFYPLERVYVELLHGREGREDNCPSRQVPPSQGPGYRIARLSSCRMWNARGRCLGLNKNIPLTHIICLQFRVEAFDLFNTPQFDQPGSATFEAAGRPQIGLLGAGFREPCNGARQIQFGLKLIL